MSDSILLRSGASHRRHRRHRHHLRAAAARHAGHHHRPSAFPAEHPVPERPHPGRRRVRAAGCHHRRRGAGRARLAHADRAAHRWVAASRCPPMPPAARWWPCGPPAPTRASAAVRPARGQVRGRRAGHRAHRGQHLHHGCGAQRHHRRHRWRRAAGRALRPSSSTT